MKNVIVYGVIFLFAFALVTGALIFMNAKYKNIFVFDFSPETGEQQRGKNKGVGSDSLKTDSTAVLDSTFLAQDSTALFPDSVKNNVNSKETKLAEVKNNVQKTAEKPIITDNPIVPKTNNTFAAKKDSIYQAWLKETVKLYEAMDSKKVAKVILAYSDNIARDLILRMRKKKAAEVLSEFKPEVVTRLISVN